MAKFFTLITAFACLLTATSPATAELPLEKIVLPPGFSIDVYAADIPDARSLARGPSGTIFVGNRKKDQVYALVDADGDHRAETVHVLAKGLTSPNGVAVRGGDLFVAERSRILRFDAIESRLADPPEPVVIYDDYPRKKHHGWKFIAFGPDDALYVPVGAPCNVCEAKEIFSTITRLEIDADGEAVGQPEIVARGVRNTVGFDWHPQTGQLWFTDNGRDRMGNDIPPDELNVLESAGAHFGFPYCHGKDIRDPKHGDSGHPCSRYQAPVQLLGPHVAALGMRFYTGELFPAEYRGDIFIAEHGSWNRDEKIGYRVMRVPVKNGQAMGYEVFAEGWLQGDEAWGRPVDLLVQPDGSLLVSDDEAGAVYRISYDKR